MGGGGRGGQCPPTQKAGGGGGKPYTIPPLLHSKRVDCLSPLKNLKAFRPSAEICPKIFSGLRPESNSNINISRYFNLNYRFTFEFH